MTTSSPDDTDINFWSSYPINWPALYTLAGLFALLLGLQLWWGAYENAAKMGLMLVGGAGLIYARVLDRGDAAASSRPWRWGSLFLWGIVGIWSGIQLVQAWMASG